MLINLKNLYIASLLFLFLTTISFAQGTTGSIEGTVTDLSGAGVLNAAISIESLDSTAGLKRTSNSSENGYFIFSNVPPGNYKITIEATNFTKHIETIVVLIDSTTTLKPELEVSGQSCCSNSVSSIDPRNSQADTNITKQIIADLPRDTTFSSILKYAPNVRPEPLAGGFQIDGGSGAENMFVIDGQEVTNYRMGILNTNNNLPIEFLQELQVKSTGFEAEYQGATGGIVNVVTVGGNNNWQGNFGLSFSPNSLNGDQRPILNRFGGNAGEFEYFTPKKDDGTNYFPVAALSGPVLKDKLWFSAIYAPQIFNTNRTIDYFSTGSNPSNRTISETIEYKAQTRAEFAFLRLDSQPVSNIRLFGTFLWNPVIQDGVLPSSTERFFGNPQQINFGGSTGVLRGAELLSQQGGRQNSNTLNGQITWTATKNLLINFRAGRNFLNENLNSYGRPKITRFLCSTAGSPENVPGSNCSRGFQNIASNYFYDYDSSTRTTFDADAALIGINLGGFHNFKFGYQFNRLFNEIKEGYTDTGIVILYYNIPISTLIGLTPTPGNMGSGLLQRFGRKGEDDSTNQSLYAQDSWQIMNRLTLNLGIRFEQENIPKYNIDTDVKFNWGEKISPRIGVAFDLTGDGKTKVFGSYGWFYDRLKYQLTQNLGTEIFTRDYFEILPGRGASYTNYSTANILGANLNNFTPECPIINGPGFSVCRTGFSIPSNIPVINFPILPLIDPDLKPTRQSEYTFGFERELGNNFLLAGRFTHKQLDQAIEDVGVFNDQGSEYYSITNPGQGIICSEFSEPAISKCPEAERKYDAVEIKINKRAPKYFFNANYTWSRLFGNYSGLASSDEFGRTSPNTTRYFDLPFVGFDANGNPDNGLLATDRPHVFKAFGGYVFDWQNNTVNRTTVSAFTTFQSGTPQTTVYSLYNVSNAVLFGRGDLGRTEMFSETDLAFQHSYRFGKDRRFAVEPYIQIQNLFDEKNVLASQTSISSTDFRASTLTAHGCTTCQTEANVFDTIFNRGGIQQFVVNYLNARGVSSSGRRNDYGQPTLFQLPRNFRFGFRFLF